MIGVITRDAQKGSQYAEIITQIKGKTTGSGSVSHQLRPFTKWGLLLKEEFARGGSKFFPFREVACGMGRH